MAMKRILLASALALSPIPALAQQGEVCINQRTGQVDQAATQAWQQMRRQADPQAMSAMSGTWYGEVRSPQTNQVDHRYQAFSADGQFQYQSRVCGGMVGTCSDFYGNGAFAARFLGPGQVTLMIMVSDLNRNRECAAGSGRFIDNQTMVDSYGVTWRRYR